MSKITVEEFLSLSEMEMQEMSTYFKKKSWLTLGPNPYRKDLREWSFGTEELQWISARISAKSVKSLELVCGEKDGAFFTFKNTIEHSGFLLIAQDKNELSEIWIFENGRLQLTLKKFGNIGGLEAFRLLMKKQIS